ncbi:MAG: hypothetical protein K6C32_00760 [Bacilli bacterium]|nr:hypothetical protein [Bacilli bacterium]
MRLLRFLFTLLLLTSFISCSTQKEERVFDYEDFIDLKISWDDLLTQEKETYFVYVYSEYCSHCNHIKQGVLKFIFNHQDMSYLIQYSSSIPIDNDLEKTIGKDDINDIFIKGTPTLLSIDKSTLIMNITGESTIAQYIENYPTYL